MNLTKLFTAAALLFFISSATMAQSYDDTDLGLDYEPSEIVEEWDDWFTNPTQENAFISDYMDYHQVPQTGMQNLNRKETWYWWISHNPTKVEEYIELRDENMQ